MPKQSCYCGACRTCRHRETNRLSRQRIRAGEKRLAEVEVKTVDADEADPFANFHAEISNKQFWAEQIKHRVTPHRTLDAQRF